MLSEVLERSPGPRNRASIPDHVDEGHSPSLVSVVIPAYNEAAGIAKVVAEVLRVLDDAHLVAEIIIVDDGSTDGTGDELRRLHDQDRRVKAVLFSRNFGKEAALLAGLRATAGQVVITMDSDLQHPPAVIPALIEKWRRGAKVVHAVKRSRDNDSWLVRARAAAFNVVLERLTGLDIRHSSDFKLLDRVAVDTISHGLTEHRRFYRGLTAWIGYPSAMVPFDVGTRDRGVAKMSLGRLVSLAIVAVVTFTSAPLRLVTLLGLAALGLSLLVGAEALWSWWRGAAVSGFTTLILTLLILGSFIMISLGIIGEYIAKIYDEIKARPTYLIAAARGFSDSLPPADHPARDPPTHSRKSSFDPDPDPR